MTDECITGFSPDGGCVMRPCCESQGVECCGDCDFFENCNSACGQYKTKTLKEDTNATD